MSTATASRCFARGCIAAAPGPPRDSSSCSGAWTAPSCACGPLVSRRGPRHGSDWRMADTQVTELILTGGERLRVEGDQRAVEAAVISAARGSIMELAWLIEAATGERVGVNPEHVVMVRVSTT